MSLETLRAGLVPKPRRGRRRLIVVSSLAGAVLVATVGLGTALAGRRTPSHATSAPAANPVGVARSLPSTTETTAAPVRVWPTTTLPPQVVRNGDAAFAVEGGAFTAVGRFRCDAPMLALVRRDGAAFLFASWATAGADVVAAPIGHVDQPRGLRVQDSDGDGCDELLVDNGGGLPVVLRP